MKTLNEEINRIQEIMGVNVDLLTEASKLDILINKIGLSPEQAEFLDSKCGSLSVWMYKKIRDGVIDYHKDLFNEFYDNRGVWSDSIFYIDEKKVVDLINNKKAFTKGYLDLDKKIVNVVKFIKGELKGNLKSIENLKWDELSNLASKYMETAPYQEKNPIIIDFRDKNGYGFYWANLQTHSSIEECKRMNHCGMANADSKLYSLRSIKPLDDSKTHADSHLTASISYNGILTQLKGKSNSKPKEEYYKYIIQLFLYKKNNGDFLIKKIKYDYKPEDDFQLDDLNTSDFEMLERERPDLFGHDVKDLK